MARFPGLVTRTTKQKRKEVRNEPTEFADNGVPVRTVTCIITDGNDEHSIQQSPRSVASVAQDLLRQENHIIAAMGIDDGHTDFKEVFKSMGIPEEWIITPGNSPREIRDAFQLFSRSAVKASQSGESFSQTALGGFAP